MESPHFGTDNGPPCTQCRGTIYGYAFIGDHTVSVLCVGCHAHDYLRIRERPETARECSALHRRHAAGNHPLARALKDARPCILDTPLADIPESQRMAYFWTRDLYANCCAALADALARSTPAFDREAFLLGCKVTDTHRPEPRPYNMAVFP